MELMCVRVGFFLFFFSFGAVSPHLRAVGLDYHLIFRSLEEPPGEDGRGRGSQEGGIWVGR